MDSNELTRRRMMRNATAAVGAATLTGSAGCLGSLPFVGGGAKAYTKWLPDPRELNSGANHLYFSYKDMSTFSDNKDELHQYLIEGFNSLEGVWSPASFDWDETSDIIRVSTSYVVTGDFSKDDVVGDLEDEDWDHETDYEGFTLMLDPDDYRGMAVSDGTLVHTQPINNDRVEELQILIDTSNGDVDRFVDEEEVMKTLTSALGGGDIIYGRTMDERDDGQPEYGKFDHQVAWGRNLTVNGETTKARDIVVYDEKDDVDTDDLEEWVDAEEDNHSVWEHLEDVSYKQNGRKGIIEGTMDTDEYY